MTFVPRIPAVPPERLADLLHGGGVRRSSDEFLAAFWARVDRSAGPEACWPWLGASSGAGYGVVQKPGDRTQHGTHRIALVLRLGRDLAPGELACHHCDNPPCCNPDHLFPGSVADNARDASAKGRLSGRRPHPTSCINGHPFDDVNTAIRSNGSRACRPCHRAAAVRYRRRQAAA